jgi:hypothetical protein
MAHALASSKARIVPTEPATLERFREALRQWSEKEIPETSLDEKLTSKLPRTDQMWQLRRHDLDGDAFDFREHKTLAALKVADPAHQAQPHYRIKLYVTATDNNIETGPTTTKNKVPIILLVVSENELLSQILLEEDILAERLGKALDKLKNGKTLLDEQVSKLAATQPELSLVSLRAEEVRKFVQEGVSTTREVSADFDRILQEMEVNRVRKERVEPVDNNIVQPLREIIDPSRGNFATAEAAVTKLWEELEKDAARQAPEVNPDNLVEHRKRAEAARDQVVQLIDRLDSVLRAIGGEIDEGKVIRDLEGILRDQSNIARDLAEWHARVVDDVLRRAAGGE